MKRKPNFADESMKKFRNRIHGIYSQASEELTEKVDSFFASFEAKDKKMRKLLDEGKITKHKYIAWRENQMMTGKRWKDLRDTMVEKMNHADEIAASYMNGELPSIYAHNYNETGIDIKSKVKGISFDIVNERTVRNLSTKNKTLLPYKVVDGKRIERWNTKRVNAAMLQGILQGESIPKIAKRLMGVTTMNEASATRNARTAFTGAQNKGRLDAMNEMAEKGVIIEKEWLAITGDSRTRDAHRELHRTRAPLDEPFVNSIGEIMYPGDIDADPANVYNCRCSMRQIVVGIRGRGK